MSMNLVLVAKREIIVLATKKQETQASEFAGLPQTPTDLTREVLKVQDLHGFTDALSRYRAWVRETWKSDKSFVSHHLRQVDRWIQDQRKQSYDLEFKMV